MGVVVPTEVQLAVCRGQTEAVRCSLTGTGANQATELADRICAGEKVTDADLRNLRTVLSQEAATPEMGIIQAQLGGDTARQWVFQAQERATLTDRLFDTEVRARERIQGHMEAVYLAALSRVGRRVADLVKRGGARGHDPVEWLDKQPLQIVRAAVDELDEAKTREAVEDLDELVTSVLLALAATTAALVSGHTNRAVGPETFLPEPTMRAAVDGARTSLLSLILGRLSRDSEIPTVPPNIAQDVLHIAGGADHSPVGGVPKTEDGRVLVAGIPSNGDGFTTSVLVLAAIEPGLRTVHYWQHSGAADANPIHEGNDGKEASRCDFRNGAPGGRRNCGCTWRKRIEAA